MNIAPVRKSVLVRATPEHTFAIYVGQGWWPKAHSLLASGSPQKKVVIESRAGGRWYEIGEDGSECDWGKVLAVDPPRRLLLGWQINGHFQADPSAMTELEIIFTPAEGGTRVDLEHRGFESYVTTGQQLRDAVDGPMGWGELLKMMSEAAVAAPQRYFVCKLILPRPTFMADMTQAEGKALGAHVSYWTGLMEKKRVLLFGPVGDPAGVWGLGVLAAPDEAEARKIAEEDPALTAGVGFTCAVYPMLRTMTPQA